jgi:hypothetical protein
MEAGEFDELAIAGDPLRLEIELVVLRIDIPRNDLPGVALAIFCLKAAVRMRIPCKRIAVTSRDS